MSSQNTVIRDAMASMDKQRALMDLMRTDIREQERLFMYQILNTKHDVNDLPSSAREMITTHYQRGNRFKTFLKQFGYIRRGRSFQFFGPKELNIPNIVPKNAMDIDDLPAEVVNSMWLHLVLKRKQAAQKAKDTRRLRTEFLKRKHQKEEEEEEEEEDEQQEDEYSLSGF